MKRADRIVVIVKGQVQEIGNHDMLMENQDVYYNLVRRYVVNFDDLHSPIHKHKSCQGFARRGQVTSAASLAKIWDKNQA